jgi:L-glutamine:scyllo-inosose aminotransferase/L-glutamine:2-deoxy-scyllo-inosose/3-amino-2,3-dideoxy-scyllo-inosose aminotransferase
MIDSQAVFATSDEPLAILGGSPVRSRPWPSWPRADEKTEEVLRDVLHSGRWAISGPYRGRKSYERRFAEAFAEFNGVQYAVPTTSGTASLTLALLALGVGPGDEVLTPGLTWVACASSVFCVGATPTSTPSQCLRKPRVVRSRRIRKRS